MRIDDFNWFISEYMNIYHKYGRCYVAIKNKTILGAYSSAREAIDNVSKKYQRGTFIVQECNGNPSGYTCTISTIGVVD